MLEYYRFKGIHDLYAKGEHAEARHLLAELQARYVTLCDENNLLKVQVQEFEDILFFSRNLIFDGTCYWLLTGTLRQGPFCHSCFTQDGRLARLTERGPVWVCSICGTEHDRDERPSEPMHVAMPGENPLFGAQTPPVLRPQRAAKILQFSR